MKRYKLTNDRHQLIKANISSLIIPSLSKKEELIISIYCNDKTAIPYNYNNNNLFIKKLRFTDCDTQTIYFSTLFKFIDNIIIYAINIIYHNDLLLPYTYSIDDGFHITTTKKNIIVDNKLQSLRITDDINIDYIKINDIKYNKFSKLFFRKPFHVESIQLFPKKNDKFVEIIVMDNEINIIEGFGKNNIDWIWILVGIIVLMAIYKN
jgi:hypothetical protein